ncbi:Acetyl esterase/lipase [Leifsonia sp. CL147]|nr:Acetyl esterase/lipase [Leifsonia sp. CL154]SFL27288.1 Acetyl esterase/lipase [Leifsonia sp. CL147]
MATYGPTMPAEVVPMARAAFEQQRLARGLDELVAGRPVSVTNVEVPGDETGPASEITIFSPESTSKRNAVFYIHGGGMVMGHRLDGAEEFITMAEQLQVPVIAVAYRLAPENPFPAAADDVRRTWLWVVEHAAELGVDADGLLLVGASSGGGLAAGLALRLRDEKQQAPLAVGLLSPMLDDRNDSVSSRDYDGTSIWDRRSNLMAWDAYLGAERSAVSPYAAPARAADLSGLPPTFLEVGSSEVFRDEVTDFASRLWATGNQAELHVWAGGFHGFSGFAPEARVSVASLAARADWLRRILAHR